MPTLIFFGVQKPYFFFPSHSPRFFATLPSTHFSGAGIKRHQFLDLPMLAADANSVVPLHFTSLDLHPPQQRTASVLRFFNCFIHSERMQQKIILTLFAILSSFNHFY